MSGGNKDKEIKQSRNSATSTYLYATYHLPYIYSNPLGTFRFPSHTAYENLYISGSHFVVNMKLDELIFLNIKLNNIALFDSPSVGE